MTEAHQANLARVEAHYETLYLDDSRVFRYLGHLLEQSKRDPELAQSMAEAATCMTEADAKRTTLARTGLNFRSENGKADITGFAA